MTLSGTAGYSSPAPSVMAPSPSESGNRRASLPRRPTHGLELEVHQGARDQRTNIADSQLGDARVNTDEQGRFGNIEQNTTHQGYQQDR